MLAVKITGFLGQIPRTAERLLPDTAAQEAQNVNLTLGELRPVRPALTVHAPAVAGDKLAAFRAVSGASEKWRTWPIDVDAVRGPFNFAVEPRYYWTGDGCPRYASFTDFGTTEYALGQPAPTVKPTVVAAGGVGSTVNRIYGYTFYQPSTGEESAVSPLSDNISGKVDGTWTLSGLLGAPANTRPANWNTSGLLQRFYRTTGTSATFQLVAERAVSTADYVDTITDALILGNELISADWLPPPVDLTGLIVLPNGSMAGFVGTELYMSEPYQPHAWPAKYQLTTNNRIVGIANFGTTIVIGTTSFPEIVTGQDPSFATKESFDISWPCLSKRSVVSVGTGVVYSTTYGLAYIGQPGPSIYTQGLYTREEWTPLNPASMICAFAEGRLFVAYTPVGEMTRMLSIYISELAALTTYIQAPLELYVDAETGLLYLVGKTVDRWDGADGERLPFNWLSKEIELQEPINLAAGRVEFKSDLTIADEIQAAANFAADLVVNQNIIDTQPGLLGAFNQDPYNALPVNGSHINQPRLVDGNFATITLYKRGQVEFFTRTVLSNQPFRLPSGFKSDILSIRLTGSVRVSSVKLAESMLGLKQI